MLTRLLATLVAAAILTGCTTVPVSRGKAVAETGKKYVEAMGKVNDLAYEKTLSFSANLLASQVPPRLSTDLDAFTESHQARSKLIDEYKVYLAGLTAYFTDLEALANGDQSEATSAALGKVVDSLMNQPPKLKVTDDQKVALTGLAGMIAKQFHSAAVEKALRRDADVIAQALVVTDNMLNEHIRQIVLREKALREKLYAEKVVKPFSSQAQLGDEWKKAWTDYVRAPPSIAILEEGRKASATMQLAWKGVLRGDYSLIEIQASLANVKASLDTLSAAKDAF